MKKLIIILLIPFSLNAQIWDVDFNEPDKKAHGVIGYFSGMAGNSVTYTFIKDTKLKPWWSKLISFGVGAGSSALLGHLKEKRDRKRGGIYNKKDFRATFLCGIAGSFTFRLVLWGAIPDSKLPEGEIIYENRNDIPVDVWPLDNKFLNKY